MHFHRCHPPIAVSVNLNIQQAFVVLKLTLYVLVSVFHLSDCPDQTIDSFVLFGLLLFLDAEVVCLGEDLPLVLLVELNNGKVTFSFLSASWAALVLGTFLASDSS